MTVELVVHASDRKSDEWRHIKVLGHDLFKHSPSESSPRRGRHWRSALLLPSEGEELGTVRRESFDQLMWTRPVAFDSAPYLAAFVASSCTAMAIASADFGRSVMSGPLTSISRLAAMKGDSAFSTILRRSAPSQFCWVSTSWAPAIESSRDSSASLTVTGTVVPFNVWAAMDWTVASVFLTR